MRSTRQHYEGWADAALPALDGRSPREAVATSAGRRAVDVLLKTMEMQESQGPEETRFDFTTFRRRLGLVKGVRRAPAKAGGEQQKLVE